MGNKCLRRKSGDDRPTSTDVRQPRTSDVVETTSRRRVWTARVRSDKKARSRKLSARSSPVNIKKEIAVRRPQDSSDEGNARTSQAVTKERVTPLSSTAARKFVELSPPLVGDEPVERSTASSRAAVIQHSKIPPGEETVRHSETGGGRATIRSSSNYTLAQTSPSRTVLTNVTPQMQLAHSADANVEAAASLSSTPPARQPSPSAIGKPSSKPELPDYKPSHSNVQTAALRTISVTIVSFNADDVPASIVHSDVLLDVDATLRSAAPITPLAVADEDLPAANLASTDRHWDIVDHETELMWTAGEDSVDVVDSEDVDLIIDPDVSRPPAAAVVYSYPTVRRRSGRHPRRFIVRHQATPPPQHDRWRSEESALPQTAVDDVDLPVRPQRASIVGRRRRRRNYQVDGTVGATDAASSSDSTTRSGSGGGESSSSSGSSMVESEMSTGGFNTTASVGGPTVEHFCQELWNFDDGKLSLIEDFDVSKLYTGDCER